MEILRATNLCKTYRGSQAQQVLSGVSLSIQSGDCVALLGASGSGKSTLLNCLGLLDDIDEGTLEVLGVDVRKLSPAEKARFRLENLGFVFQFHHLIPELSALENLLLPASIAGRKSKPRALELLERVGLKDKVSRFPWQLSGGEQQRIALARALINQPKILLTDEATGNLDRGRSLEILELLLEVNRQEGMAVLSVTHDEELAAKYQKRLRLKDGRIWD